MNSEGLDTIYQIKRVEAMKTYFTMCANQAFESGNFGRFTILNGILAEIEIVQTELNEELE